MDIYDFSKFREREYSWEPSAKRQLKQFKLRTGILVVVMLFLLALTAYVQARTSLLNTSAYFFSLFAVVVLTLGLRIALNSASRRKSGKMPPKVRHDYALYAYHHQGRKNNILGNQYLMLCAKADVCQKKYELAEQALDQIVMEKCRGDQLKQVWLLKMIVALSKNCAEESREAYICYSGIEVKNGSFPSDESVSACLDTMDAETLTCLMKENEKSKVEHPIRIGCISILLYYCIMFYTVGVGINTDKGYALRPDFVRIALPFTCIATVLLVIAGMIRMFKSENFSGRKKNKVGFAACCMVILCGVAMISFGICQNFNRKEEVVTKDGAYTYLEVRSGRKSSGFSYVYRTNNPFVMQRVNEISDATPEQVSDAKQKSEDTNAEQSLQNAMTLVYNYLDEEKRYSDMELNFCVSAKGETYAVICATQEEEHARVLDVEYRLYYNGTKENKNGTECAEIVLQKWYPNGENNAQLINFYLVDPDTLEVIDEHDSSW